VTIADAGLPGRAKISFEVRVPVEELLCGTVAKVVGLPGFMFTRPKWIVPPRERSIVGFRRSSSPIDTPPVVTIASTRRRAARRASSRAPGLEGK
jgi:hypothetical protein